MAAHGLEPKAKMEAGRARTRPALNLELAWRKTGWTRPRLGKDQVVAKSKKSMGPKEKVMAQRWR